MAYFKEDGKRGEKERKKGRREKRKGGRRRAHIDRAYIYIYIDNLFLLSIKKKKLFFL